ncbi:MAG TPA: FGGY-family carbohydrate kinase [Euzebya sp.]|nr:FGGY-family carbohydrate kinase [Euzebya sp.]
MSLLIGLDVGTSSTKGVLVRPDGVVAARAQVSHDVSSPHPGWFEHDADRVWWSDFVAVVAQLTAAADGPIAGLAVSGIGPCLLPADDRGPLRPAILYGVDSRATREITELEDELGAEAIVQRCGSRLTTQAVGPKMRWLQHHEPQVWARTRTFFMASSYLVHRLTGAYVLDHHSASQCTPLYDVHANEWIPEWAERIAPGLELPALHWSGEVVGTVTDAAARLTGLPPGLPVTAGTIDAWAEAESAGVRIPGDVMVMYGTTMFMIGMVERLIPSNHLWGTAGLRPGVSCAAAGMATSGSVTAWLRDLVGSDYDTLTAEAKGVPPGSGGLLLLPYFAGERTPLFDDRARGLVLGLTLDHRRSHLYRACMEGTACGVRHNLAAMRDSGVPVERLVAVGGGTTGGLWMQIVSDVTGLAQDVPNETIGASYGDAMLAACATGIASTEEVAAWNPVVATVAPDDGVRAVYDELYELYTRAYTGNADAMHRLAAVGSGSPLHRKPT